MPEGHVDDRPGSHTVHGLANRKNELFQRRLAHEPMATLRGAGRYLDAAEEAGLDRAVVSPSSNSRAILERAELGRFVDLCVDGRTMARRIWRRSPRRTCWCSPASGSASIPSGRRPSKRCPRECRPRARPASASSSVSIARSGDAHPAGADVVVADLAELLDPALGGAALVNDWREP